MTTIRPGFDSDIRGRDASKIEEEGDFCCVSTVTMRTTLWLVQVPDMPPGYPPLWTIYSDTRARFQSDCTEMPCNAYGDFTTGTCEDVVDDFNRANDVEDVVPQGEGTAASPLKFTFKRKKKMGCCADSDCATVYRDSKFNDLMAIGDGSNEFWSGSLPLSDEDKDELKEKILGYWWFGGTGEPYLADAISWDQAPKCCAEDATPSQRP